MYNNLSYYIFVSNCVGLKPHPASTLALIIIDYLYSLQGLSKDHLKNTGKFIHLFLYIKPFELL